MLQNETHVVVGVVSRAQRRADGRAGGSVSPHRSLFFCAVVGLLTMEDVSSLSLRNQDSFYHPGDELLASPPFGPNNIDSVFETFRRRVNFLHTAVVWGSNEAGLSATAMRSHPYTCCLFAFLSLSLRRTKHIGLL